MDLNHYRSLGHSGLFVSPFALGTMTFGQPRWGTGEADSWAIFDAYVEAGGNFIDTADVYGAGASEQMVGQFIKARGLRDRVVLATKYGFNGLPSAGEAAGSRNPQAGGNGRRHVHRALEASLKRLGTDTIDLYWMHVWDSITPVEEVLQTLGDLQRAGKIRYFGFSDLPAWFATRAATLAAAHGLPGPIALQVEYGLTERTVEQEHLPSARQCGLGTVAWGPLGAGFLSGKYTRGALPQPDGEGRLHGENPYGQMKFTERNWVVLDAVRQVATEQGRTPAEVALAWVVQRRGVSATILGAKRPDQLHANLRALEVSFTPAQQQQLDAASALPWAFPYPLFAPGANAMLFGGRPVAGWFEQA
jgi:aryl-alcohol dehydrogenase-like predicted oxidoreductase